MGGVTTEFGNGRTVVYHAEDDDERRETSLTAVVVWRPGPATHAGWRARLRRWQFRLGLDPLHRRFSIGREAGLWYGSCGPHGDHTTLFHPLRRVVRVLGTEYPLPPQGGTLVLLIDETGESARARAREIPTPRRLRLPDLRDPAAGQFSHGALEQELNAWRDALRADAEIAAFLGDDIEDR